MIKTLIDVVESNFIFLIIYILGYMVIRFVYLKLMKRKIYKKYEFALFFFYFYFIVLMVFISPISMTKFEHKGINLIPFKEILRYPITSYGFFYNVVGNILIYIPFGFFVGYIFDKRFKKHTIRFLIMMATILEFTQILPFVKRSFDVDDIILNILGALFGYYIFKLFRKIRNEG